MSRLLRFLRENTDEFAVMDVLCAAAGATLIGYGAGSVSIGIGVFLVAFALLGE